MLNSAVPALQYVDVLRQMRYPRGRAWYPLPSWCHFYAGLGATVVQQQPVANTRIVAGVAIPTRAFAAALTAFGVTLAIAQARSQEEGFQAHFDYLVGQPDGTPVSFLTSNGEKRTMGKLRGKEVRNGLPMLKVQLSRGLMELLPPKQSLRVQLAAIEDTALSSRVTWQRQRAGTGFASSVLAIPVHQAAGRSRLDSALVGVRTLLEPELTHARFAIARSESAPASGTLQEVVRVRDFARGGDTYRSDFLATAGKHQPPVPGAPVPDVAIFDGGNAFLRWRHLWPHTHAIVLLDRTGPYFEEGVQQLNAGAVRQGAVMLDFPGLAEVPSGCELLVYRESVR